MFLGNQHNTSDANLKTSKHGFLRLKLIYPPVRFNSGPSRSAAIQIQNATQFKLLHPFNSLFSRTTWVSRYQKGRTILDFNEARDDGWQWHQLDHMQIICTLLQTDNHTSTLSICSNSKTKFQKQMKADSNLDGLVAWSGGNPSTTSTTADMYVCDRKHVTGPCITRLHLLICITTWQCPNNICTLISY